MTITLHAPQIIYLSITFLGLAIIAVRHGEPRRDEYNIFVSLVAEALLFGLFYWGGFFG